MKDIIWASETDESTLEQVGGKGTNLAEMMTVGLPVPAAFMVTAGAFQRFIEDAGLDEKIRDAVDGVDVDANDELTAASDEIQELICSEPVPKALEASIRDAYDDLSADQPADVAIRSSATAEDLPEASFAGQQDTYLWICGVDAVLEHVRRCWSSTFTDRAISYRRRLGYDHEVVNMSVGVQKMVEPKAAGVAFTLNPSNGDRSQVAIDASWGFGEAVVSGEVTPDNYLVDKVLHEVTRREISCKSIEYRLDGAGVEVMQVDDDRANKPCLTDEEVCAVATMARRAERHYGRPQDVEWAIDRNLPDGANVVLLQSRPETVWSNRTREAPQRLTGLDSIVNTLVAPLAAKKD